MFATLSQKILSPQPSSSLIMKVTILVLTSFNDNFRIKWCERNCTWKDLIFFWIINFIWDSFSIFNKPLKEESLARNNKKTTSFSLPSFCRLLKDFCFQRITIFDKKKKVWFLFANTIPKHIDTIFPFGLFFIWFYCRCVGLFSRR